LEHDVARNWHMRVVVQGPRPSFIPSEAESVQSSDDGCRVEVDIWQLNTGQEGLVNTATTGHSTVVLTARGRCPRAQDDRRDHV
jgi:hypothetical protein